MVTPPMDFSIGVVILEEALGTSNASRRLLAFAEILGAAHRIERRSDDRTSACHAKRFPNDDGSVIAGRGETLPVRMYGNSPARTRVTLPSLGQPATGPRIPQVQLTTAIDHHQGHAVGQEGEIGRAAGVTSESPAPLARRDIPQGHDFIARGAVSTTAR